MGGVERAATCVLTGPEGSLVGTGVRHSYTDLDTAAKALRNDDASILLGALPFDPAAPAALIDPIAFRRAPDRWRHGRNAEPWRPRLRSIEPDPSAAEHQRRIESPLDAIAAGLLDKVVLARRMRLTTERAINGVAMLRALVGRDPRANGFYLDLAAFRGPGAALVGASPELLIRRTGSQVYACPLAGSAPRRGAVEADRTAARLLASEKDRREHRFVVDFIVSALAPLCSTLRWSEEPEIFGTPDLVHLGTPIRGTLADPGCTSLDLARVLQPTPALGGTPRGEAMRLIEEIEGDRGFYGGAVGWCDRSGDGAWSVCIRCAEIAPGGHVATAFAGGGIVAGSEPAAEVEETMAKFRAILSVFDDEPAA
ncbi:isochorismate synthase [Nocardia brasiliensis]|uniref:isochorismate synthase n=1 Tax=Nocardia brasiliensis TaxID=37326 RepID=UPI002454E238|nr:isochorismate synthase [Nocardia brasiliensis]